MKLQSIKYRRKGTQEQQGFSLLELMVAIFILGVGLLGIAGLQSYSLNNTQISGKQTYAILYSQELLDNIRSNADALALAEHPYVVSSGTAPTDPGVDCYSATSGNTPACSPLTLAKFQVYQLYQQLQQSVSPNVALAIDVQAVTNSNTKVVSINLSWQEQVKTNDAQSNTQAVKVENKKYSLSALI